MKTLEILGHELVQIDSFHQLRHHTGERRIGLQFWIRYAFDGTEYWLQYTITAAISGAWLSSVSDMGLIYLTRADYDITLPTAQLLSTTQTTPS